MTGTCPAFAGTVATCKARVSSSLTPETRSHATATLPRVSSFSVPVSRVPVTAAGGRVAVLLGRNDPTAPPDLLGHVIWTGPGTIVRNDYPTLHKIIDLAADRGVRTPRILAVGVSHDRTL